MVEHLVQFQKGLGLSPSPVTFHAVISYPLLQFTYSFEHLKYYQICKLQVSQGKVDDWYVYLPIRYVS